MSTLLQVLQQLSHIRSLQHSRDCQAAEEIETFRSLGSPSCNSDLTTVPVDEHAAMVHEDHCLDPPESSPSNDSHDSLTIRHHCHLASHDHRYPLDRVSDRPT
ncbi:unnamed protein product [Toxocara canis]|uniref:Uncharacterized protein n=1 Tax=Toxocara canis TaxID=6265 RepID=A0A183UEP3_TOXCA|nr:unnamed protein product [Toxocara canis]